MTTKELQQAVLEDLERHKPKVVIYKTGTVFDAIDGVDNRLRHPLIAKYLDKHYRLGVKIRGTQILKRVR